MDRRVKPGDDDRETQAAAATGAGAGGSAAFTFSTIAWKAAGSRIARSDR